jgi:hypothetical protein
MQKINSFVSRLQLRIWTIPLILLVETLIAYGLLALFQGFYFDDWQMIWLIESGYDYWEFYAFDRPFSAWTIFFTAPILGTNTIAWHVFTILLRWLTTLSAWWVLKQIWPRQQRLISLIAMLFAVYPAFIQQPISVAYSQHFLTYLLFLVSFGCMLRSLEGGKRNFWIFTALGLISQAMHLFTMEYFWGLELVRILGISFYYAQRDALPPKKSILKVFKLWSPYLVVFGMAVIWRLFIYAPLEDPNELRLLTLLLAHPLQAVLNLIEMALQDSLHMLIKAWDQTLQVGLIDLQDKFSLLVWLLAGTVAAGLVLYSRSLDWVIPESGDDNRWRSQLVYFSLAVMLLGPLPVWATDKQITIGMYSDRFALAGMFGAAILLVVFLDRILATKLQTVVSVAVLAGLAIGLHIRTGNDYRWDWVNQQRFFWQMHWRVPGLQPDTVIFSDGAVLKRTGDYPTAFALNLLYPAENTLDGHLPYWFFELDQGFDRYAGNYLAGQVMEDQLRTATFEGWSLDSILIDHNSQRGSCLWVVGPGDELIYSLPGISLKALPLSDLSRIESGSKSKPNSLFGSEPPLTWCYYFQKAELARQFGDWQQVSKYADQVVEQNFDPQNRFEWRPFVDGYLHTGNYSGAYDLTLRAYERDENVRDLFCSMWITSVRELPADEQLLEYAELTEDQLRCKW